jgi:hypothetical protein
LLGLLAIVCRSNRAFLFTQLVENSVFTGSKLYKFGFWRIRIALKLDEEYFVHI